MAGSNEYTNMLVLETRQPDLYSTKCETTWKDSPTDLRWMVE